MTELVIAVFDAASAANAAVQDLEVARIRSAVIQEGPQGMPELGHRVTVAVAEIHTPVVTEILNQYGPVKIEERVTQRHRR